MVQHPLETIGPFTVQLLQAAVQIEIVGGPRGRVVSPHLTFHVTIVPPRGLGGSQQFGQLWFVGYLGFMQSRESLAQMPFRFRELSLAARAHLPIIRGIAARVVRLWRRNGMCRKARRDDHGAE